MLRRKRQAGFTLLELLVVVIIVGILAAVALPQFSKMTRRARTGEGTNIVGAIMTAEWVYYQEKATFTTAMADLLVDVPVEGPDEHFNYALSGAALTTEVTVTGTGDAGSPAAGITVTGKIKNDGTRNIAVTGL